MVDLLTIASAHSRTLFGSKIDRAALRANAVARGTRHIYLVQPVGVPGRPVIAKVRVTRSAEDRAIAAYEAENEFALLAATRASLDAQRKPENTLPVPLLVCPEQGIVFMERVEAEPIARVLWRWALTFCSSARASHLMERCGDWLHTFSRTTPLTRRTPPQSVSQVLDEKRSRHHVYRLIGLAGPDLVESMIVGIEKRLVAYGNRALLPRIAAAYAREFGDFGERRDLQGPAHGKYSPADIFVHGEKITVLDLEQGGAGSAYLDIAYFLYQLYMIGRWRPFGGATAVARLRAAFVKGRAGTEADRIEQRLIDPFIAYYMVNSLRPGGGVAGNRARAYASWWLDDWLHRESS